MSIFALVVPQDTHTHTHTHTHIYIYTYIHTHHTHTHSHTHTHTQTAHLHSALLLHDWDFRRKEDSGRGKSEGAVWKKNPGVKPDEERVRRIASVLAVVALYKICW